MRHESGLWLAIAATFIATAGTRTPQAPLELYPEHSRLHVSERIHYTVMVRRDGEARFLEDYTLESQDPSVRRRRPVGMAVR